MGVAVDAAGSVAMTGHYRNWVDLDGGVRAVSDVDLSNDMFVAKLDVQGKTLWTRRFAGPKMQIGQDVAFDRDGNVIAVGQMNGTVDFGTGELEGGGKYNTAAMVVKLDSSGRTLWARLLPDAARAESVAIDASGNAYVTAAVSDGLSVMKLDPEGKLIFDVRLGSYDSWNLNDRARVTTDGKGHLVVVWKRIVGGVVLLGEEQHEHDYREHIAWIAKLDEAGGALWSRALGEGNPRGVAIDARGDIMIVNDTSTEETLAGFAAKLAADGRPLWTKRLGPRMWPNGMAADANGNMVVTGILASGGLDVCGQHIPDSKQTAFLAKLDPAGSLVWARQIELGSWGGGEDVAVHPAGAIVVAGWGSLTPLVLMGGPPYQPHLFVTKIGP